MYTLVAAVFEGCFSTDECHCCSDSPVSPIQSKRGEAEGAAAAAGGYLRLAVSRPEARIRIAHDGNPQRESHDRSDYFGHRDAGQTNTYLASTINRLEDAIAKRDAARTKPGTLRGATVRQALS